MSTQMDYKMLIEGKMVEVSDGGRFDVINPANEEVVGSAPAEQWRMRMRQFKVPRKFLKAGARSRRYSAPVLLWILRTPYTGNANVLVGWFV